MNKTKKFFSYVLVCIIACLTMMLTACGGVEGTYRLHKLTYTESGMMIEEESGEEILVQGDTAKDLMVLTLNDNGSAVMITRIDIDVEEVMVGTWVNTGVGGIILTFDELELTASCNGMTIEFVITDRGEALTFVLKKEFVQFTA